MSRLPVIAGAAGLLTIPTAISFNDQTATYLAAHELLTRGSMRVPMSAISAGAMPEFHNGISDRMPGMIALTVPFAFDRWIAIAIPSFFAILATLFLIEKLWNRNCVLLTVLCTPLIYVSREAWPQTFAVPLILAGFLSLQKERWVTVLPIVLAIGLIRPPMAVLAALLFVAMRPRSRVILYSTLGLVLTAICLLVYTHHYFGVWALTGGYSLDGHTAQPILSTLYTGLISPQRGILFYCPWILFIKWNRFLTITALYTLAEWYEYNAWGGNGYLGFRYAVPFVILAIPRISRMNILPLLGWSIGVGLYCLLFDRYTIPNIERNANLIPTAVYLFGIAGSVIAFQFRLKRIT